MIKFWLNLVKSGAKRLEDVPVKYRDAVKAELDKG